MFFLCVVSNSLDTILTYVEEADSLAEAVALLTYGLCPATVLTLSTDKLSSSRALL